MNVKQGDAEKDQLSWAKTPSLDEYKSSQKSFGLGKNLECFLRAHRSLK